MSAIIDKIKSRGYFRILFRPIIYKEDRILPLSKCKDIVEKYAVNLRGWDYPHFPRREGDDTGLAPGNNFYEGWIDWQSHKEKWWLYQSGQFLHYEGLSEDWHDEDSWIRPERKIEKMVELGVAHTVYLMTEIFEFLLGLTKEGIYKEGLKVTIGLNNTRNRKLWLENPLKAPFMQDRKTGDDSLEFKNEYSEQEIIENSNELAIMASLYFFERFGWTPLEDLVRKDQQELLKRRR